MRIVEIMDKGCALFYNCELMNRGFKERSIECFVGPALSGFVQSDVLFMTVKVNTC